MRSHLEYLTIVAAIRDANALLNAWHRVTAQIIVYCNRNVPTPSNRLLNRVASIACNSAYAVSGFFNTDMPLRWMWLLQTALRLNPIPITLIVTLAIFPTMRV
jgi:hypothetical protein